MSNRFLVDVASSLTLAQARSIADSAINASQDAKLLPLAIAVLDSGGHLVHFVRQDGCGIARFAIAVGKAAGALGMGVSSGTIGQRLADRPAFVASIAAATTGQFVAVPGGVLILDAAGKAIGAVGVSGDASARDEYAAISGVRGAGLISHPAEPADNWSSASL